MQSEGGQYTCPSVIYHAPGCAACSPLKTCCILLQTCTSPAVLTYLLRQLLGSEVDFPHLSVKTLMRRLPRLRATGRPGWMGTRR